MEKTLEHLIPKTLIIKEAKAGQVPTAEEEEEVSREVEAVAMTQREEEAEDREAASTTTETSPEQAEAAGTKTPATPKDSKRNIEEDVAANLVAGTRAVATVSLILRATTQLLTTHSQAAVPTRFLTVVSVNTTTTHPST